MSTTDTSPYRDGTSQSQRQLPALHPDYFQLEERSLLDLLRFAREYGQFLQYYNTQNQHVGNWSKFLGETDDELNLEELAAFADDPSSFDHLPEKKALFSRPHRALFLSFLKLLQQTHGHINQLTKRQLDFYFRTALGFSPKQATPNQVYVLARLSPDQDQLLIPKGTLLDAGEDGQGNPVHYQTDHDLIANQARIARLMSVFVEKEVRGIPAIREDDDLNGEGKMEEILRLVYQNPENPTELRPLEEMDTAGILHFLNGTDSPQGTIDILPEIEGRITQDFHLRIAAFQRIIDHYNDWLNEEKWLIVNTYLTEVYNRREETALSVETFLAFVNDPHDFNENFNQAFGFTVNGDYPSASNIPNAFQTISGVANVYDLFVRYRINPTSAEGFIETSLFTDETEYPFEDFALFSQTRMELLDSMKAIHQILHEAATKADLTPKGTTTIYSYSQGLTLRNAFDDILNMNGGTGIGDDTELSTLASYLTVAEAYLQMSLEEYFFIRNLYLEADIPISEVPDWQWQRADQLLLQAYNKLPSFPALPEKLEWIQWKNVHQALDTTQIIHQSVGTQVSQERWKPFGGISTDASDPEIHFPSLIGWGICSPSLHLSEGKRTLTVTLTFLQDVPDLSEIPDPFRAEVSTEKGWVELGYTLNPDGKSLEIMLEAAPDIDPFAPIAEYSFPFSWPALRLIVRTDQEEESPSPYELFKDLLLQKIELVISVEGVRNLWVQTKEGRVDPQKPFQPFGSAPHRKDRVFIAHPELARQKLTDVSLHLEWKTLPETANGFGDYYASYAFLGADLGIPALSQESFSTTITLKEKHRAMVLENDEEPFHQLFPALGSSQPITTFGPLDMEDSFSDGAYAYLSNQSAKLEEDIPKSDRYFELELSPQDFLHKHYSTLLLRQTLSQLKSTKKKEIFSLTVNDIAGNNINLLISGIPLPAYDGDGNAYYTDSFAFKAQGLVMVFDAYDPETKQLTITCSTTPLVGTEVTVQYQQALVLPEPFTPELNSLHADYSTSLILDFSQEIRGQDCFFHVEPFGIHPITSPTASASKEANGESTGAGFLPNLEAEGTLYIGLENLQPPQDVSFLFQMAEGSANPDLVPAKVQWAYLKGNEWDAFEEAQLVSDATDGLLNSGQIQLHLPQAASKKSLRMPQNLHWIRAVVDRYTDSLSQFLDIRTQAIKATWVDPGEPTDHLEQALGPGTIAQPVERILELDEILQPYPSFRGHPAEKDERLYLRASERIRHKQRALTLWDYEHLVLGEFPDIYRAKAISSDQWIGSEPGSVHMVVVPDTRMGTTFDPFEPKVAVSRLREIQEFLTSKASPHATIHVQNPRFRYVQVRVLAHFHDPNNFGFYAAKLEQELIEYLAPWAFDKGAEVLFGGRIHPYMIVDFVENRPYVDYIEHPTLFLLQRNIEGEMELIQLIQGKHAPVAIQEPDIILVSTPTHYIEYPGQLYKGIGYARIGFDLQIAKPRQTTP